MKSKGILSGILLFFVAATVVYTVAKESAQRRATIEQPTEQVSVQTDRTNDDQTAPKDPKKDLAPPLGETKETVGPASIVGDASKEERSIPAVPEEEKHAVIVYYFHGTARCERCRKFEAYTKEALLTGFPEELKTGLLEWRVLNVEEPANEHFVEDFQLTTRAVVLVDAVDGRQQQWKDLKEIWFLVDDKAAFLEYIQSETRSYLETS